MAAELRITPQHTDGVILLPRFSLSRSDSILNNTKPKWPCGRDFRKIASRSIARLQGEAVRRIHSDAENLFRSPGKFHATEIAK